MSAGAYTILSNNPKVQERFPDKTTFFNSSATDVLTAARNAIHKGASLISHPLSGGSIPAMNPYKSVLITEMAEPSNQLDFISNRLIEDALMFYKKNGRLKYKAYNEKLLDDFQTLDLDMVVSALAGMKDNV